MSETIARTIYVHTLGTGKKVFGDWAVINTELGQMIEPFNFNRINADGTAYDPSDSVSLITEIQEVDPNKLAGLPPFADSDEGTRLHGGILNPRSGF